ncbi:dihydrofolate reductase [Rhodococcoides yunnanense]|uniref:dihydrofolate reductase n=1 Tax=Rhodococcoides yunnanense TaxID=278209 RepID=UPI000933BCC3|nr:dihydrofolate reductase [Rhodococcus yunnanensis]
MTPNVGLIWAQTVGGAIGDAGSIPWRVPEDTAHFKAMTLHHPVIMGRKTWDSLPPRFRPLPGRRNIVVTRNTTWRADGAEPVSSLEDGLVAASDAEMVWVIGGGEIYRAALPFATELQVTEIDLQIDGDTAAPAVPDGWTSVAGEWQTSSNENIRYRFVQYGKAYQTL